MPLLLGRRLITGNLTLCEKKNKRPSRESTQGTRIKGLSSASFRLQTNWVIFSFHNIKFGKYNQGIRHLFHIQSIITRFIPQPSYTVFFDNYVLWIKVSYLGWIAPPAGLLLKHCLYYVQTAELEERSNVTYKQVTFTNETIP